MSDHDSIWSMLVEFVMTVICMALLLPALATILVIFLAWDVVFLFKRTDLVGAFLCNLAEQIAYTLGPKNRENSVLGRIATVVWIIVLHTAALVASLVIMAADFLFSANTETSPA